MYGAAPTHSNYGYAPDEPGIPPSTKRTAEERPGEMQTPNEYLRALLLELAEEADLSDSAIARAHNRAYADSTLAASTIQRFRTGPPTEPPSEMMEQAYAAATGTTRQQNWEKAFQRWRAATVKSARESLRQPRE